MKNRFLKFLSLLLVLLLLISVPVSAKSSDSFSRFQTQGEEFTIVGREMYEPVLEITGSSLKLDTSLKGVSDIYSAYDGKLYVLCGEISRIFVLDKDYSFLKEIEVKDAKAEKIDFTGAQGIFVSLDGIIYISDTENSRILVVDFNGKLLNTIETPESEIIPEDFLFQPTSIVNDDDGNFYVVSMGSYYGALLYDSEFNFKSFFGANNVQYDVLDVIANLWDLLTSTDAKRAKQERVLPYAFTDIAVDKDGYLYTVNGAETFFATNNGKGQIQRLSPNGENTLLKRDNYGLSSTSSSVEFLEDEVVATWEKFRVQNFDSISVSDTGFIFALDTTYGLVYVYDEDCNLITAFGGGVGQGKQIGMFSEASAMTTFSDDVIVADSTLGKLCVFRINDYGKTLQEAIGLYIKGDYLEAEPLWQEALKYDSNCIYAYKGMARVYYTNKDYDKALEYSRMSYDYVVYDLAFQQIRNDFIERNFVWIFGLAILLIAAIIVLLIKFKNREEPLIKNKKLSIFFKAQMHPFDAYAEIKYKNLGSVWIAVATIVLYSITAIVKLTDSSFLFKQTDVYNYNSLFTLGSTAGVVVLWIIANWLVSTLLDGKGTFKEVAVSTGYGLFPMILGNVLATVLSYVLTYDDAVFLTTISTVMTIYSLFLICVSNMSIHDYSFGKFILTAILSLFLMILIVFVIFMVVIMLQQFGNFFYTIYMEVAYR